jgi:DNA-binding LacI/PurR family transcriptional regulator
MDIRTIARAANVSIATVSRTMNGVATVNPRMAKRVWEVIDKFEYFPNTQARSLVSGRSRIFGLIVSEITNPFFPELIQGFEDIAVEHGLRNSGKFHQLRSQAHVPLHSPHART